MELLGLLGLRKWSTWKDVTIREDADGKHILLMVRTCSKTNNRQFKNIRIDGAANWGNLFHGNQGIDKALANLLSFPKEVIA